VGLARDGGSQVVGRRPDGQAGGRVAGFFEVLEVAVRMAGLALGGRTEDGRYVVVAFDVGALCEVQVTAVGLRLAGKCVFEVLFGLGAFQ
jgi:hypothetical protein